MVRMFANGPGDQGSIPDWQKKKVLDAALLNTHHYKVQIKGKVEQSSRVAIEKGAFGSPSTTVTKFT